MAVKPNWPTYALDLISRLREHDIGSPTTAVVGILGYVAENDDVPGVDEHERAIAKAWLSRLVDPNGNPLDDKGRDALEIATEENAIHHYGTLSCVVSEADRCEIRIAVLRATVKQNERAKLRELLIGHAATYVDHLIEALYEEVPV